MASWWRLWLLPLGPGKPSGGSWSFATAGRLGPEMRALEQVLELLVSEQVLALLSQESHSRVPKLLCLLQRLCRELAR